MAARSEGLRVLITGAARGIGRATCARLTRASLKWRNAPAQFLAVDLVDDELSILAKDMGDDAVLRPFHGDVTDPDMPARAVAAAVDTMGGIDCLVNNAGFARHGAITELPLEMWDVVFHANVRAPFLFAQHGYAALKESQGAMVIVGSISGVNPQIGLGAYSASKAAAIMLARHLAVEWSGSGIRVNAVSPGPIHTATTGRYYSDPAIKAERAAKIPLQMVGEPNDIAEAIAFLCGPDASYCNGVNLIVDGGLTRAGMQQFALAGRTWEAQT